MSEAALSRIANLIKVEDDLSKVGSLKQQFIKEKSAVDVKLNSAIQLQIDSIISNLTKLNKSSTKLGNIKNDINKINQIYEESVNIPEYETISKMTQTNQFFTQVNSLLHDISNFQNNLNQLNILIDSEFDLVAEDLSYKLHGIFKIHYNLTQIRDLYDYLEVQSVKLTDDLKSIIYNIIKNIKITVSKFDTLLKECIISIMESIKEGNLELVFKVIKIIDFEAKEDLKLLLTESLQIKSPTRLKKRNYKKFFYDKLEESLEDTFDKCVEHFNDDPMLVYDNLNWLEDDLVFVNESLVQFFPSSWDIVGFIQNVYYNKLHNFTMDIISKDPPAEDLLKILAYDNRYNKFVQNSKKSIIGEDLKNVVLDDYLKVIVSKMDEWNDNLIDQETKVFSERNAPPDLYNYHQIIEDEDAQDNPVMLDIETPVYVLPDFKIPLTMLKEQADVAAESGYGKILVGVIQHWSNCYMKRVISYQTIIDEEFDNYMSIYNNEGFLIKESKAKRLFRRKNKHIINLDEMTEEELNNISRSGLIEYLAALGNTFEINTDRLQDKFLPIYKEKVHVTYQNTIEQSFEDTITPSTELNAQIIRTIVDIIINDLYPALSQVFTSAWYDTGNRNDEEPMAQRIVDTIGEYMEELRGYTTYDIYLVSFNVLLDTFIAAYIRIGFENILHGDGKKIDPQAVKKYKSFSEGVIRDATILYGGMQHLFTRKDSLYLMKSLRALENLSELATCENPMQNVPQIWENEVLPSFYYCSVDYVKGICLCRKDMEKNEVNLLTNQLVKIQKQYHLEVEPPVLLVNTLNDFYYN